MASFRVDDVVIVRSGRHLAGKCGVIRRVMTHLYAVEFDDRVGGHDCGGACKSGYGYYVAECDIVKMEPVPDLLKKQVSDSVIKARKARPIASHPMVIFVES